MEVKQLYLVYLHCDLFYSLQYCTPKANHHNMHCKGIISFIICFKSERG